MASRKVWKWRFFVVLVILIVGLVAVYAIHQRRVQAPTARTTDFIPSRSSPMKDSYIALPRPYAGVGQANYVNIVAVTVDSYGATMRDVMPPGNVCWLR